MGPGAPYLTHGLRYAEVGRRRRNVEQDIRVLPRDLSVVCLQQLYFFPLTHFVA